jgi:hypothetical protein
MAGHGIVHRQRRGGEQSGVVDQLGEQDPARLAR